MKKLESLVVACALPALILASACGETVEAEPIPDAGGGDGGAGDGGDTDSGPDPFCDRDMDTFIAITCGGDDCDDERFEVNPGALERCSFIDEDCDDENNENLDCRFVASGEDTLYRIDPFAESIATGIQVTLPDPDHGLLDIDIDPQHQLLAVTSDGLYTVTEQGAMSLLAHVATPERTNGMAIDSAGTIFITNDPYSPDVDAEANTVDRYTGDLTLLGTLDPYVSSGDCVTLKDDSLLMTAPDPDTPYDPNDPQARTDLLVYVDSYTAETRPIGPIGFAKVYGLSASWEFLFGVTDFGEVIQIDPVTGAGTLLFEEPTLRFWGAANAD